MNEGRLEQFLHERHAPYETIHHARALTAQETAASAHIRGRLLAKTVMVNIDGRLAMVVLPAARRVHFGRLREATGAHDAGLACESEFRDLFPDCEVGAMPPFGNLYGIEVYVDESLVTDDDIAFNAGTHTRVMRMPYREFERLVAPHHVHMMH
ncbi:MAG TPA: YbaK/EbsC family protein [Rudaea sp.]|jgi:Ala-tRNA(Pro) deacylase|nr:YbaK/EbsC family protein [Rudaea sp.]